MGVICQILIKNPKGGVHRTGSTVRGLIKYSTDEPKEYNDIILSFVGSGRCRWEEKSGKSTTTYVGTEEYTSQRISLIDDKEKPFVLKEGINEYPFEFPIPEDSPSSFKNYVCTIKYEIILEFVKPKKFSMNNRFNTEIKVQGNVKPDACEGKIVFGLEKKLLKLFSSTENIINLKAEISKTTYTLGENSELNVVVKNATDITIPSIKAELYEYIIYTSNGGHKKTTINLIKESTSSLPSVPEKAVANMSTVVPVLPQLYSEQNSKIMAIEYKMRLTVKLPMFRVNRFVEVPIVVRPCEIDTESCEECLAEEPPSYWEVMTKDNNDSLKEKENKEFDSDE